MQNSPDKECPMEMDVFSICVCLASYHNVIACLYASLHFLFLFLVSWLLLYKLVDHFLALTLMLK